MAMRTQKTRQYAIRFPIDLAEQVEQRKGVSISEFVLQAVRAKLEQDRDKEIEAGLACLANDPEANDISAFTPGQRKVMARGD